MHVVDLNVPGLRVGCLVTLVDDGDFLGVFVGLEVDAANQRTGRAMVSIKQSGRTLLVGDKPIAIDRLVVVGKVSVMVAPSKRRSVVVAIGGGQRGLFESIGP